MEAVIGKRYGDVQITSLIYAMENEAVNIFKGCSSLLKRLESLLELYDIYDCILVAILDKKKKKLSHRLQLMSDFTLPQTVQSIQECEVVVFQVHQQGEACTAVQEFAQGKAGESWNETQTSTCNKCKKRHKLYHRHHIFWMLLQIHTGMMNRTNSTNFRWQNTKLKFILVQI